MSIFTLETIHIFPFLLGLLFGGIYFVLYHDWDEKLGSNLVEVCMFFFLILVLFIIGKEMFYDSLLSSGPASLPSTNVSFNFIVALYAIGSSVLFFKKKKLYSYRKIKIKYKIVFSILLINSLSDLNFYWLFIHAVIVSQYYAYYAHNFFLVLSGFFLPGVLVTSFKICKSLFLKNHI